MNKKDKKNLFTDTDSDRTPLTEEEIRMLRSEIGRAGVDRSALPPHDTSAKAKLFRFIKRNKVFSSSVIAIAILLVVSAVIFTLIALDMNSDKPCKDDFLVRLGEDSYELKYKDLVFEQYDSLYWQKDNIVGVTNRKAVGIIYIDDRAWRYQNEFSTECNIKMIKADLKEM